MHVFLFPHEPYCASYPSLLEWAPRSFFEGPFEQLAFVPHGSQ